MKYFSAAIFVLCLTVLTHSQEDYRIRETNRNYEQGDWITYSVTRFVRHISLGDLYVYFATTGGITRYNFFSNQWDYPFTISNGLADNDIHLVGKDLNTGFLWCTTPFGISYMEPASMWWFNTFYDEMPGFGMDDYVTSIGFGENRRIYIVTFDNEWFSSDNVTANFQQISQPSSDEFIKWIGAKEETGPHGPASNYRRQHQEPKRGPQPPVEESLERNRIDCSASQMHPKA